MMRVFTAEGTQSRMVKTGSSYLSQSELTLTFGIGKREKADRVVIEWPSGIVEEYKSVAAGAHVCRESKGITAQSGY
jgi:hypothetical protein